MTDTVIVGEAEPHLADRTDNALNPTELNESLKNIDLIASAQTEETSPSKRSILISRPLSPNGLISPASRPETGNRYIYRPDTAYSTPPTSVLRTHNGLGEGQLLYQIGKIGPLVPTYAPYWVKDPPQRPAVIDLRLSPSQRSRSCYSPEFLSISCSVLNSRPATSAATSRPATSSSLLREVEPNLIHYQSAPPSPSGHSRQHGNLLIKHQHQQRQQQQQRNRHAHTRYDEDLLGPRPCTARPQPCRYFARTAHPRMGASAAGVPTNLRQPKPLPNTQYTEFIQDVARSSFETGGIFLPRSHGAAECEQTELPAPTLVHLASKVVVESRAKSRVVDEMNLIPRRLTHDPPPTEAQARAAKAMSHDAPIRLRFRQRMKEWGV
ncbi:hypothetical protein CEUSTIGMA_g8506.t1 [Chlamydomonas eustigma]|uniref:Uncharacterized protein n=1 Tax=Chlamydomonas eustigma TaxID=1157962 RepID=A0A250XDD9_9CHLO|nr:hypothetical protein CEUSTIGMA_g8506.t1 [Chlamydomonas eustigma]|eukprot:GAX81071.1 hypothetical protein CEUSTIGMA_g8506.t1 [Chlamydomonas eustigma]